MLISERGHLFKISGSSQQGAASINSSTAYMGSSVLRGRTAPALSPGDVPGCFQTALTFIDFHQRKPIHILYVDSSKPHLSTVRVGKAYTLAEKIQLLAFILYLPWVETLPCDCFKLQEKGEQKSLDVAVNEDSVAETMETPTSKKKTKKNPRPFAELQRCIEELFPSGLFGRSSESQRSNLSIGGC